MTPAREKVETIARLISGDVTWLAQPDTQAALDLIAEAGLNDAARIRTLFNDDVEWLEALAQAVSNAFRMPVDRVEERRPADHKAHRRRGEGAATALAGGPAAQFANPNPRSVGATSIDELDELSPDDVAAWKLVGVTDPKRVRRLVEQGLGASFVRCASERGVDSQTFQRLAKSRRSLAGAGDFLLAGHSLDEFLDWKEAGFGAPAALGWMLAGIDYPSRAELWKSNGFSETSAGSWIRAGFDHAQTARRWRNEGYTPTEAKAWFDAGVTTLQMLRPWVAAGCRTPSEMCMWQEYGIRTASTAAAWASAGLDPQSATQWERLGIDPSEWSQLERHGLSPKVVRVWVRVCRRPLSELLDWIEIGVSPERLVRLAASGVDSSQALGRLHAGVTPTVYRSLVEGGLSHEEAAIVVSSTCDGRDAETLRTRGAPGAYVALRQRLVPVSQWGQWHRVCDSAGVVSAWNQAGIGLTDLQAATRNHGLRPAKLKQWIALGFPAQEMLEAHAQGFSNPNVWATHCARGSTEAKRQATQPSYGVGPNTGVAQLSDGFQRWLDEGRPWLKGALFRPSSRLDFLQLLFEEGLEWVDLREDLFDVPTDADWLDEMQHRAIQLLPSMTKEPIWPQVFESEELTVVVDASAVPALAWVGVGFRGGLLSFDIDDFDVHTGARHASRRYVAAVAIAWFVDCCLILRSGGKSPQFTKSARISQASGFARAAARYMPRMSFVSHYERVLSGRRESPRAHWVDSFVRTLKQGQRPSEEARRKAPPRIRRRLQPNQTWVTGFHRGGADGNRELVVYLSKYSALSDTMALADRSLRSGES